MSEDPWGLSQPPLESSTSRELPPLHYHAEALNLAMVHQLFRPSGFRISLSKFEPSMTIHSPIKIVCTLAVHPGAYPDPAVCCRQALLYFRYHFGADRVLCATWNPAAQDPMRSVDLEVALMLSIDDVQPWHQREVNMIERNLGMDRSRVSIIKVRPTDSGERQSNVPGIFNCVMLTVPQQWERELESVAVGDLLPLQSVWWRLLGYVHPLEMYSRIQGVALAGFATHLQHTFTISENFISAIGVLLLHVESTPDAIALANIFDGRVLGGFGRGVDRHLFPVKAAPINFEHFLHERNKLPLWVLASPLIPHPPTIPGELFGFFNLPLAPNNDEDDFEVTVLTKRWPGARSSWRDKKFVASEYQGGQGLSVQGPSVQGPSVRGFRSRLLVQPV